jgi:hypothetical protein
MGYSRSAAFKTFQANSKASRQVVNAAAKIKFGGKRRSLYQDSMLSSAVLLAFANFERYVGDVVDDLCKGLCAAGLAVSKLPIELRVQIAVVSKLSEWSDIKDPSKLQSNIWKYKQNDGFVMLEEGFVPKNIDVDAILAKASYPKIGNILKLLRRLGIADPKTILKVVGGHAIEQKLTSIHDARAELAHTGKLPLWTTQDYLDRLVDLEAFAKVFDKILFRHFCGLASAPHWIR